MGYELILTDNLKHTSWSLPVLTVNKINQIFNTYIFPIVNKHFYDDDYSSISLTTNKLIYSYMYIGSHQWSLTVQPEISTTILDKKPSMSWTEILNQWSHLLGKRHFIYRWEFNNIDKLGFEGLETLFGRTMYLPLSTNQLTLIVKSI